MAEVMAEKGYVATSVADVLARSGVSRHSFYQVFDSKLDCFMAAFDVAGDLLMQRLLEMAGAGEHAVPLPQVAGDRLHRFERAFAAYLEALAIELPYTQLFLIEVYAAGPPAIRRRGELQAAITAALADLMGAVDDAGRLTCQMIVAATSTLVTQAVADNDLKALRAIGPLVTEHVRTLWNAGAFRPQAAPLAQSCTDEPSEPAGSDSSRRT